MNQFSYTSFWKWFLSNSRRFRDLPSLIIIDELCERIATIDKRLSVELSSEVDTPLRELVITSHGDWAAFKTIVALCKSCPSIPGWKVVAFKPPRGFLFNLPVLPEVNVSQWKVVPLKMDVSFKDIGIRFEVGKGHASKVTEPLIWEILEEGVGEILCSLVSHVEWSENRTSRAFDMGELPEILHSWGLTRGPDECKPYLPDRGVIDSTT